MFHYAWFTSAAFAFVSTGPVASLDECTGTDIGSLAVAIITSPDCDQNFLRTCAPGNGPCQFNTEVCVDVDLTPSAAIIDSVEWSVDVVGGANLVPMPAGSIRENGVVVVFPYTNPDAGGPNNVLHKWPHVPTAGANLGASAAPVGPGGLGRADRSRGRARDEAQDTDVRLDANERARILRSL
jgi:hypothetical protein